MNDFPVHLLASCEDLGLTFEASRAMLNGCLSKSFVFLSGAPVVYGSKGLGWAYRVGIERLS